VGLHADMELSDALTFAASRRNGVLATAKRDGRPQLSNITYLVDGGDVLISITADRAKYVNLTRNPAASLYVAREDFWAYVVLEGDVTLTPIAADAHDDTVEQLISLYRGVAGEHSNWDEYRAAMVADRRVVVRLRPSHAYGMLGS
jgi:PPOX class probable F420-dependent enzyme